MSLIGKLAVGTFVAVTAGYFLGSIASGAASQAASSGVQVAEMTLAETIAKRQEAMKELGGHMKAIKAFVEENQGTAEDVKSHAEAIQAASGQIVALFPEGTSLDDGVAKTAAKPVIWEKMDMFKAAADALGAEAGKLAEVAATGDATAIGEQFGNLGKIGCGGCHQEFRQKQE
jgi:cytochrome c556